MILPGRTQAGQPAPSPSSIPEPRDGNSLTRGGRQPWIAHRGTLPSGGFFGPAPRGPPGGPMGPPQCPDQGRESPGHPGARPGHAVPPRVRRARADPRTGESHSRDAALLVDVGAKDRRQDPTTDGEEERLAPLQSLREPDRAPHAQGSGRLLRGARAGALARTDHKRKTGLRNI